MKLNNFEQQALKQKHHKPNRRSSTKLTSSYTPDIKESLSDKHLLISAIGLLLFIIILILV